MTNKIEISWKGQMLFESVAPEGNVMIDAAEEVGGQGKGLRPKALMLTSLAGCSAMDVVSLLKKMRAEVDDFRIEVIANLTDEHPKFYDKVHVIYRFYGSHTSSGTAFAVSNLQCNLPVDKRNEFETKEQFQQRVIDEVNDNSVCRVVNQVSTEITF